MGDVVQFKPRDTEPRRPPGYKMQTYRDWLIETVPRHIKIVGGVRYISTITHPNRPGIRFEVRHAQEHESIERAKRRVDEFTQLTAITSGS